MQLFIRHHAQGLSLTPEGMRMLRDARALLRQAEELQSVAGELSELVSGPLAIGCLVTVYPLLVPELVHSFRKRYASARVHAVASDQSGLFERLRSGEITIAVTYDMSVPADLAFEPLAHLPPFAFVAAGHPLARRAQPVAPDPGGGALSAPRPTPQPGILSRPLPRSSGSPPEWRAGSSIWT